jgi:ribosomal protein L20A (L18A)
VDNLYKSHKEVFEKLFSIFSNKHKTPIDKVDFAKVDEFENLWNSCGLIEGNFV